MKKLVAILFLLTITLFAKSQANKLFAIKNYGKHFEFVQIDCNNDSVTVLNQFPNSYYTPYFSSCYNPILQKYYLTLGQNLRVLDAVTGNLDTMYVFTSINPQYFIHIVFNPADGFIYGIKYNQATFDETLAKFDPATGVFTDLFPITPAVDVVIGCKASFDPYLGEYYIQSRNLATINIYTAQIVNNIPFQNPTNEWLDHFAYSCKQQRFFGLTNNYHNAENYFSEVDISSGISTRINASPLPTYFYKHYLSGSTIDNFSDIYYYAAARGKLYGIDINTGNIVYNHDYGPDFQFLFLESASPLYCLSDYVKSISENVEFEIYPNPGTGIFNLSFSSPFQKSCELKIYSVKGELIYFQRLSAGASFIDLSGVSKGIYSYELTGQEFLKVGKLVLMN